MATVFVEESAIDTPTVQMENVLIYNGFGFVDSSNGPVDTGGPDQVGSFPLIKNGEMYYYHEAVNVPAQVTLTDIALCRGYSGGDAGEPEADHRGQSVGNDH